MLKEKTNKKKSREARPLYALVDEKLFKKLKKILAEKDMSYTKWLEEQIKNA